MATFTYHYDPKPSPFQIDHDRQKRLFAITGPDGQRSEFHDRAVRFLVVEPDPETGEMQSSAPWRKAQGHVPLPGGGVVGQ